jgi:hypothetical protein
MVPVNASIGDHVAVLTEVGTHPPVVAPPSNAKERSKNTVALLKNILIKQITHTRLITSNLIVYLIKTYDESCYPLKVLVRVYPPGVSIQSRHLSV